MYSCSRTVVVVGSERGREESGVVGAANTWDGGRPDPEAIATCSFSGLGMKCFLSAMWFLSNFLGPGLYLERESDAGELRNWNRYVEKLAHESKPTRLQSCSFFFAI